MRVEGQSAVPNLLRRAFKSDSRNFDHSFTSSRRREAVVAWDQRHDLYRSLCR